MTCGLLAFLATTIFWRVLTRDEYDAVDKIEAREDDQ